MTKQEATGYLDRLLTGMLASVPDTFVNGQDYYQKAAMIVLDSPDKFICQSDDDFTGLMYGIARMLERQELGHLLRDTGHANPLVTIHDHIDEKGEVRVRHFKELTYNPWTSDRAQAMELIEFLPFSYRRVFLLYYIEGYTEREIGEMLSMPRDTVHSVLADGVRWIKDELQVLG